MLHFQCASLDFRLQIPELHCVFLYARRGGSSTVKEGKTQLMSAHTQTSGIQHLPMPGMKLKHLSLHLSTQTWFVCFFSAANRSNLQSALTINYTIIMLVNSQWATDVGKLLPELV